MPIPWTVRIHKDALEAIYRLPRGEAVKARDLIHSLAVGPIPEDAESLTQHQSVFKVTREGYQIIFEVIDLERTIRILHVRPL
jgi:mRNA-degrading endonuclease RelE of RelBE toxin-antitoxin system